MQTLPPNHDITHLQGILGIVPRGGWCIEGGAHCGIWTRHLVQHFSHVFAFEPNPDHFAKLQLAAPQATTICAGLWHKYEVRRMAPGDDNDGQWHVADGGQVEARLFPLDCTDWPMPVTFIKLDIEGAEWHAITGARKLIEQHRPFVMIEQNGLDQVHFGLRRDQAVELLQEMGMREIRRWNKDRLFGW